MKDKWRIFHSLVKNGNEKLKAGRKRIRSMSDSSDDDTSANTLSITEKEARLKIAKQRIPGLDAMLIQDALFHKNWDVEAAVKHLIATKGVKITIPVNEAIHKSVDVTVPTPKPAPVSVVVTAPDAPLVPAVASKSPSLPINSVTSNSAMKTVASPPVQRAPKKVSQTRTPSLDSTTLFCQSIQLSVNRYIVTETTQRQQLRWGRRNIRWQWPAKGPCV